MSANAVYNATVALRKRLEHAINAPGKVFVGPLDDSDSAGASLILFLYRILPNASLRNRGHRVASTTPPPVAVTYENSLPLDLYYLLTVGTTPNSNEELLLQVLGAAMQDLQVDPELTGPDVGYETVHVSLEPLTTEETSRVWALFPTANYRTSVAYLVTPVWIDPRQPEPAPHLVVEDRLDVGARADLIVE
jgi:hypothetical protein